MADWLSLCWTGAHRDFGRQKQLMILGTIFIKILPIAIFHESVEIFREISSHCGDVIFND